MVDLTKIPIRSSQSPGIELNQLNEALEEIEGAITSVESTAAANEAAIAAQAGFTSVAVSANISPALASIEHDTAYHNSSLGTRTVTLPSTIAANQVGKRFHFSACAAFSFPITVTASSTGLLRNKSNTSGPHTVTNGTLTVTVSEGSLGTRFYAIGGDFA